MTQAGKDSAKTAKTDIIDAWHLLMFNNSFRLNDRLDNAAYRLARASSVLLLTIGDSPTYRFAPLSGKRARAVGFQE